MFWKKLVIMNQSIRIFIYFLLLSLFAGLLGCDSKGKFEKELSFNRNLVNTKVPELV